MPWVGVIPKEGRVCVAVPVLLLAWQRLRTLAAFSCNAAPVFLANPGRTFRIHTWLFGYLIPQLSFVILFILPFFIFLSSIYSISIRFKSQAWILKWAKSSNKTRLKIHVYLFRKCNPSTPIILLYRLALMYWDDAWILLTFSQKTLHLCWCGFDLTGFLESSSHYVMPIGSVSHGWYVNPWL